jgi:hypothetical protein
MRKLLLVLIPCGSVFAASLDMSTLACKSLKINSATTLSDVQSNCVIKKQETSKGLYKVEFTNDTTKKEVTCSFPSNDPKALLNSCK